MRKCKYDGCDNDVRTPNGQPRYECSQCANNIKKYGITTPERDALLQKQGGKCAICEKKIEFKTGGASIDHQDMPFRIRGILCIGCNTGLGKLGDSIEGLERALKYLKEGDV